MATIQTSLHLSEVTAGAQRQSLLRSCECREAKVAMPAAGAGREFNQNFTAVGVNRNTAYREDHRNIGCYVTGRMDCIVAVKILLQSLLFQTV